MHWFAVPLLSVLLPACWDPSGQLGVDGCAQWSPARLPDGSSPGDAELERGDYGHVYAWGEDRARVVMLPAHPAEFDLPAADDLPPGQRTTVRGWQAAVLPVGDEGVGEVLIYWANSSCEHVVWLAPGTSIREAREYAPKM